MTVTASPQRILVLTNSFPNRSETFVLNHVQGLANRGHDVVVLAKRSRSEGVDPPGFPFPVLTYASRHRWGAPFLAAATALIYGVRHPVRFFRVVAQVWVHHDWSVFQAFAAVGRLSGRVFDVTHAEFGPLGNMALALQACGATTGPVCTSFRGSDISSYLSRHPRVYRRLSERGARFLPVCEAFVPRLRDLGFPVERIRVYHSAVDLSGFPQRRPGQRDAPGRRRIIAIGRFVKKKGFHLALDVLRILLDRGRDVELELIGEGPERESLARQADSMALGDRLMMRGWLGRESIHQELAKADLCVGTSVTPETGELEGIPNVLKEAMAVGVPLVAFDHSGVGELVRDGVTGLLVAEGDVDAMADGAVQILTDGELEANLTRAARALVEAEYSMPSLAEEAERIYRDAIRRDDPGSQAAGEEEP